MTNRADLVRITVAILSVVKLVLSTFGIDIPQEYVDTAVNVVAGILAVYAFVKHNFIGKKGKKQKENLKQHGLL
jgi:uncharacterized membrane protein